MGKRYGSGEFKYRIVLQSPISMEDGQGGFQAFYQDHPQVWAAKRALKNAEVYRYQHIENVSFAVFVIRNNLKLIDNRWKIKHREIFYDIVEVSSLEISEMYVELTAVQTGARN